MFGVEMIKYWDKKLQRKFLSFSVKIWPWNEFPIRFSYFWRRQDFTVLERLGWIGIVSVSIFLRAEMGLGIGSDASRRKVLRQCVGVVLRQLLSLSYTNSIKFGQLVICNIWTMFLLSGTFDMCLLYMADNKNSLECRTLATSGSEFADISFKFHICHIVLVSKAFLVYMSASVLYPSIKRSVLNRLGNSNQKCKL